MYLIIDRYKHILSTVFTVDVDVYAKRRNGDENIWENKLIVFSFFVLELPRLFLLLLLCKCDEEKKKAMAKERKLQQIPLNPYTHIKIHDEIKFHSFVFFFLYDDGVRLVLRGSFNRILISLARFLYFNTCWICRSFRHTDMKKYNSEGRCINGTKLSFT